MVTIVCSGMTLVGSGFAVISFTPFIPDKLSFHRFHVARDCFGLIISLTMTNERGFRVVFNHPHLGLPLSRGKKSKECDFKMPE